MAIETKDVERDARRYDREDDPRVRRLADELDRMEKRTTGPLAGGASYPQTGVVGSTGVLPDGTPAPFYGQPQPPLTAGKAVAAVGAYPRDFERYVPPAQRVMMDADEGIMDADVEAWNMQSEDEKTKKYGGLALQNYDWVPKKDRFMDADAEAWDAQSEDEKTRSYGKLALQNYDWVPQKDKAGIMDADAPDADVVGGQIPPARTAAPSARFPDEPSWGALTPGQQQQAYQSMAWGNEANLPQPMRPGPMDERTAYLESLAPELRTDEYMRLSNPQVLPDGTLAPAGPAPGAPSPYAWATQRERAAMQGPPKSRFDVMQLNNGIADLRQAYADAVRGGYR